MKKKSGPKKRARRVTIAAPRPYVYSWDGTITAQGIDQLVNMKGAADDAGITARLWLGPQGVAALTRALLKLPAAEQPGLSLPRSPIERYKEFRSVLAEVEALMLAPVGPNGSQNYQNTEGLFALIRTVAAGLAGEL